LQTIEVPERRQDPNEHEQVRRVLPEQPTRVEDGQAVPPQLFPLGICVQIQPVTPDGSMTEGDVPVVQVGERQFEQEE
jgi:hypothetical protein